MTIDSIISICLGIGLAASVGFRVFLPLFALGLASYFDMWQLNDSWQWIGTTYALLTFGVATLVEILAYFIPFIDNLLDTISVPLATIAGTVIMLSTVVNLSPIITWALAIIAGGGTAAIISGTTSATRFTSSATTTGIGNPMVASVETVLATLMSIVSIFIPVLAIIFVIFIFILMYRVYRKLKPKKNQSL